jgi:hypothetical protein
MSMTTKNLIDGDSKRLSVFNDKTGEYTDGPRLELAEALQFVHDAYSALTSAPAPKVSTFMAHFAVQAFCKHTGWQPHEIAAAEQYVTLMSAAGPAASAG